jgi:hypothetical protein
MTQVTLKKTANGNTFAFGRYPYAHHRQHGEPAKARATKWQIWIGPDLFDEYPTKGAALRDVENFCLSLNA